MKTESIFHKNARIRNQALLKNMATMKYYLKTFKWAVGYKVN